MKPKINVKRIIKITLLALLAFLVYLIVGGVVPPLFHPDVDDSYKARFEEFLSAPASDSERILCLDDNMQALLWRLRVIEAAEDELIFSTFDFRADTSGKEIMAAMINAAERNVNVKIIVDGMNGFLHLQGNAYFNALAATPNVEVRFYNPINILKPWQINYRLHDKYLIADEEVYILGGRNTNDLFLGNNQESYNIDRDILVYEAGQANATTDASAGNIITSDTSGSSSIYQVRDYFNEIWNVSYNRSISGSSGKKAANALDELHLLYETMQQKYADIYQYKYQVEDWCNATTAANSVKLLANPIDDWVKAPEIWYSICRVLETGKNIAIMTPYIVASNAMYDDLAALCESAESVSILTNAVESGANPWGCTNYLNDKDEILETGVEVYEYLGSQSLHTKTILMDDNISIVGSYNLDMRSTYLDTELMLLIDCEELNRSLREMIETDMAKSLHVLPDGTQIPGDEYVAVDMSLGKNIIYGILRVIILPIRHLL